MTEIEMIKDAVISSVRKIAWRAHDGDDMVLTHPRRVLFCDYYVPMESPWLGRLCPDIVKEIPYEGSPSYSMRVADIQGDYIVYISLTPEEYSKLLVEIRNTLEGTIGGPEEMVGVIEEAYDKDEGEM